MRLDNGQIEVVDEAVARVLRSKKGMERLRIAHESWRLLRSRLEAYLRFRHPDWDTARVNQEVARRLSGGSI